MWAQARLFLTCGHLRITVQTIGFIGAKSEKYNPMIYKPLITGLGDTQKYISSISPSLLDSRLPVPLYHQIYSVLRDAIRQGRIASGSVLPGEFDLAQLFNVSRITAKRALNELAAAKLVSRHRGRGTIVEKTDRLSVICDSQESLLDSLERMGNETRSELLEFLEQPASDIVASMLEIAPDTQIQKAVRLRTIEENPFSYLVSYVPIELSRTYTRHDMTTTPLLSLLKRAGVKFGKVEQWISAVPADPIIAHALDVTELFPLLKVERIMRDQAGLPVELLLGHYRSDRFIYHIERE